MKADVESGGGRVIECADLTRVQQRLERLVAARLEQLETDLSAMIDAKIAGFAKTISLEMEDRLERPRHVLDMFEVICVRVCAAREISMLQFQMPSKRWKFSKPRQEAMYLCRKITGAPFAAIGEFFRKNHGTVLWACRTTQGAMEVDPILRRQMEELEAELRRDFRLLPVTEAKAL